MKKKIIILSASFLLIVLLICQTVFIVKKNKITVSLNGDKNITIEVFTEYNDKSVTVKKGKEILSKNKYKYKEKSNVDTSKIGKYKIKYKVTSYNKDFYLSRSVNVVDTTAPELVLSSDTLTKDYCSKKAKNEITYTVTDNYDEDLTDKVEISEEENKLIYTVKDSSGNETIKEVKVVYDEKPKNKFTLNGKSKVTVIKDNEYKEQGASYTNGCGKKIDAKITQTGEVDTSVEGTYTITYEVEGENPLTRTVVVTHYTPKTIYLTFDDGPGANTKIVLNALDKYGVKATFFVTNQFPSYQYLIKEEHDRGHAVGVHTLTHKWSIYDSVDAYISDFDAMNEIIYNQTGSYSKIFRFPGGSGNTVSKSHSTGVVTAIAEEMTNRGFVYFDWNLSSGDASSPTPSTDKIVSNVLNSVNNCSSNCVILFHDYKKVTANAVEPILADLTSRGYIFKTLDENGPIVHAKIKN